MATLRIAAVTTASQRNRPGDRCLGSGSASAPAGSGHACSPVSAGVSKLSSRPILTSGLVTGPGSTGPDAPVNDQGVEKPLAHEPERGAGGRQ